MGRKSGRGKQSKQAAQASNICTGEPQAASDLASQKPEAKQRQKTWLDYLNSSFSLIAIVVSGIALSISYRTSQSNQQQFALVHRPVINMEVKPFKDGKYLLVKQVNGHDLYVDIQVELENVGPIHAVDISCPTNINSFIVDGTGSTSTSVVVQSTPAITLGPGQKVAMTSVIKWGSVTDEFGSSTFENMRAGKDSFTLDLPISYGSPLDKGARYTTRIARKIHFDGFEVIKSEAN